MVVLCHGGKLVDIGFGRRATVDGDEQAVAGDEMLFLSCGFLDEKQLSPAELTSGTRPTW
jgi:hypothetical protein